MPARSQRTRRRHSTRRVGRDHLPDSAFLALSPASRRLSDVEFARGPWHVRPAASQADEFVQCPHPFPRHTCSCPGLTNAHTAPCYIPLSGRECSPNDFAILFSVAPDAPNRSSYRSDPLPFPPILLSAGEATECNGPVRSGLAVDVPRSPSFDSTIASLCQTEPPPPFLRAPFLVLLRSLAGDVVSRTSYTETSPPPSGVSFSLHATLHCPPRFGVLLGSTALCCEWNGLFARRITLAHIPRPLLTKFADKKTRRPRAPSLSPRTPPVYVFGSLQLNTLSVRTP
jgi:hypothetical protein